MKIGFIGSGNMGGAIARGIVKSGVVSGKDVYLYDVCLLYTSRCV